MEQSSRDRGNGAGVHGRGVNKVKIEAILAAYIPSYIDYIALRYIQESDTVSVLPP